MWWIVLWLGLAAALNETTLRDSSTPVQSPAIGDFRSGGGGGSQWITYPGSNSSYQFNFDESSWIFAREKCLAQNADLVSISDQAELDFILSRYPITIRNRDRFVLVGLAKDPASEWAHWLDGSPVDEEVTRWMHGEPAHSGFASCAYLSVNGRILNRVSCDVRTLPLLLTRYVCERGPAEEKAVIQADSAHAPVELYLFLRQLGRLNELGLPQRSHDDVFGHLGDEIDLQRDVMDRPLPDAKNPENKVITPETPPKPKCDHTKH